SDSLQSLASGSGASLGEAPLPTPLPGEELHRLYEKFYQAMGPQYSVVLLPMLAGRPGMRMVYTFEYREPEQFVARIQELIFKVLPSLVFFYRQLGWGFDMWLARSPLADMPPETWQLEMRF